MAALAFTPLASLVALGWNRSRGRLTVSLGMTVAFCLISCSVSLSSSAPMTTRGRSIHRLVCVYVAEFVASLRPTSQRWASRLSAFWGSSDLAPVSGSST